MKNRLASFTILLTTCTVGMLLYSCNKDNLFPSTPSDRASVQAVDSRSEVCMGCVEQWIDSKATQTFPGLPNVKVDIWNDATTVYYTVYRTDGGTWTNLRYKIGCVTNSELGGTPILTYPNNTFTMPNPVNWTTCGNNSITVTIKMNGGTGGVGSPLACFTYALSNLQPNANAGEDQRQCNSSTFTMAAVPSVGSGTWSFVGADGGAVITTPGSATTTVTNVPTDVAVVLRWTETNGVCTDYDDVTLHNDAQPEANAGADQSACATSEFTMAAVPSVGTGSWSFVGDAGAASITDAGSATTTVTGVATGQSVTLQWTETNGTCSSSDDVTVSNTQCQVCYGGNESALSYGPRISGTANWFTYTPYGGADNTVTLFAGRTHDAGTVNFSAPSGGVVTITVTLNSSWAYQDVSENVKINGYAGVPVWNQPPIGQFSNKGHATGTTYVTTMPAANNYVVHVDVKEVVPCQ